MEIINIEKESEERFKKIRALPKGPEALKTLAYVRQKYYLNQDYLNLLKIIWKQMFQDRKHFLLELIQNADDAEYPNNEKPTIRFIIKESSLELQYNEKGFTTNDVIAITGVASTKPWKGEKTETGKSSHRYIGEKGIGFKSVFALADWVEIESPPWNFKLHRDTCIVPEIVTLKNLKKPHGTRIEVHFEDPKTTDIIADELFRFVDGQVESFLFLQTLSAFSVEDHRKNPIQECGVIITPSDRSGNFLHLETYPGNQQRTYFYYSEDVKFSAELVKKRWEEIGSELDELRRKVIVAIPQTYKDSTIENGKLFCFLPTKIDLPVPFFLHVDGVTTADRERLQEEDSWNRHLFDKLPEVLLNAILDMRDYPEMVESIQNFIPVTSGDGQLKSVFDDLIFRLNTAPWVRVLSGGKTEWETPEKVVQIDAFWIPVFEKYPEFMRLAENILAKKFVYPDWTTSEKWDSLQEHYHIPFISPNQVAEIIANDSLPSEFTLDDSKLTDLYQYISNTIAKTPPDSLEEIKNILLKAQIFPLEGGKFGSLDAEEYKGKIYWLSERKPKKPGLDGVVEFRIINPEYTYKPRIEQEFSAERKITLGLVGYRNDIVRTLLEDLGIEELDDEQVMSDLLIPLLLNLKGIDDEEHFSKLYNLVSIVFDSYQAKTTTQNDPKYLSQLSKISEVEFPSTNGDFQPLKSLLLPEELKLELIDTIYSESGLETLNLPQKLLKISKKDTGKKEDKRETDKKIKKLREEWRSFLILCGIKSKPKFEKISFNCLPSEFEQKDQERFVIWEEGINKKYTSNKPVDVTIIDLDEPTKTIIRSSKSTQFSDLLFTIWKDQFGELIQQKTRVRVEEIVPGEFFTKYTKIIVKDKILTDYLWAGISRDRIPLTTIDNKVSTVQSARRVAGSCKELPITQKYIDLVREPGLYDNYHEIYYDSLNVEKLSAADINELWHKVDPKEYGDIIRAAIECVKAELIDGRSLELYDKEENCIRRVTKFYLGEQAEGWPLIEKQYGDAGRELGKLLDLPREDDAQIFIGVFDEIFEHEVSVQTISRDEKFYGLMNIWSKWNETSKQLIKDDFEKSLKKYDIPLHPFIIFNNHDLAHKFDDIETIVIDLELKLEEIPRLKNLANDLKLNFPEENGELKSDADVLKEPELREIEEICDALLEFETYNDEEKKFLTEKLQLIGGRENLGQKIKKTLCLQRIIKINKEFVIDVKLPFFDEKDQLFYISKDLDIIEIISELLQYLGFGLKRHNLKDIVDALAQIRKKSGRNQGTKKGKTLPPAEDSSGSDGISRRMIWTPAISIENIPIRFEEYAADARTTTKIDVTNENGEDYFNDPRPKNNLSEEEKKAIGEQGEKYAVRVLSDERKKKYPGSKEKRLSDDHYQIISNEKKIESEIIRCNRPKHPQTGYDIKIKDGDITEYFEVKSTIDESKDLLQITAPQWQFAKKKGDLFHILRVYNTGTEDAKVVVITNPCEKFDKGEIKVKFDVRLYL